EVALNDSVAKYLPAEVKLPERDGQVIRLQDLATHTSGLPRLPTNLLVKNIENPYAEYSAQDLYQFLSGYQLTRKIGEQYEYSNLGGGLLGHVLARRANADYEALLRARICGPLGLRDTRIVLSSDMQQRLAVGHNAKLEPVANWEFKVLAGAGALRSTANDLLTFLAVPLGYTQSPLTAAMKSMLALRRPALPDLTIALGWHISALNGQEIVWHGGGTGGYSSFIGYNPKTRVGVVVLANTFTTNPIDDIGRHLLDPSIPLSQSLAERQPATVDPKLLDRYVGQYQPAPNFILTITRDGARLFAQATGQPKFELFPESEKSFFFKAIDA